MSRSVSFRLFLLVWLLNVAIVPSFAEDHTKTIEKALASVVTVGVYKTEDSERMLGFGEGKSRGRSIEEIYKRVHDLTGATGSGSGFVISRNRKMLVVTNAHVVGLASSEPGSIFVYSISGRKYEVKVVGGDSFYDLAVLEFVSPPGTEMEPIDFRTSTPRIGEEVFAIGTPLGKYPYSVSDGVISGLNRFRDGLTGKFGFLQTTASFIWGNSGGPLIDTKGKVVGINSQIELLSEGGQQLIISQINFALESRLADRLVNDILTNHGFVKRAFLGVEISQRQSIDFYGYLQAEENHPVISGVVENSPAASRLKANIGASVIRVNGNRVRNVEEILGEFEQVTPRQEVTLSLHMEGKEKIVTIPSTELTSKALADIGQYVASKAASIRLIRQDDGIYVELNDGEQTRVVSAGVAYNEQEKQMWIIRNMGDLAAAFRFAGLFGVLDYYSITSDDETELNRVHLSGDEDIIQTTVWY